MSCVHLNHSVCYHQTSIRSLDNTPVCVRDLGNAVLQSHTPMPEPEDHIPVLQGHTPVPEDHTPVFQDHTPVLQGHTPLSQGHTPDLSTLNKGTLTHAFSSV